MMEAASTSETSVNFYQTTRRNNPEDSHLHNRLNRRLLCFVHKLSMKTFLMPLLSEKYSMNTAKAYACGGQTRPFSRTKRLFLSVENTFQKEIQTSVSIYWQFDSTD
jgi:hypothetical protein